MILDEDGLKRVEHYWGLDGVLEWDDTSNLIETIRELRELLAEYWEEQGRCSASCKECDRVAKALR